MTRLHNWASLLDRFIAGSRSATFHYGAFDCCLWACDCVRIMTGVDIACDFRGRYQTRSEALRLIQDATGTRSVRGVALHVTQAFAMPRVASSFLQRGDVALIPRARDYSLGIVALNGLDILVPLRTGLRTIPLSSAKSGWRV
jgi:hypothetical protein